MRWQPLVEPLQHALEETLETIALLGTLDMPDFERDYEFVALRDDDGRYPIDRGRIISSSGLDIPAEGFDEHFVEEHVAHSNALHSRLRDGGSYMAGPMARYNLAFDTLSPLARDAAREAGLGRVMPQSVPEHHRARSGAPVRDRRGAALDRGV